MMEWIDHDILDDLILQNPPIYKDNECRLNTMKMTRAASTAQKEKKRKKICTRTRSPDSKIEKEKKRVR